MRKLSVFLLVFLLAIFALVSCGGGDNPPEDNDTVRVMVSAGEGVTVVGENPVDVKIGESVEFLIKIDPTYAFVSVSHGSYNQKAGKLTLNNVTERMNISFVTENLGYDTTKSVDFSFEGDSLDKSSIESGSTVNLGSKITLSANNTSRIFVGWSLGKKSNEAGDIVSTDRIFTFRASPDMLTDGSLSLFANYKDSNIYYYDPNGGVINADSQNIKGNEYYKASVVDGKVKVVIGEAYFSVLESAATFFDDGSFTRDGYVLIEYNTKPDGSGEAFSIGSKFYTAMDSDYTTLYCIWAEETTHSFFEYEDYEYLRPTGVKAEYAPSWDESGVIITKYNGNDERIVIPEKLGGKAVIAIAKNAFMAKDVRELVLSKNLLVVEDGAFKECDSLERVYFSDGIYSMNNEAFDESTYKSFKSLYVNATIAPRYSKSGDGAFAIKLSRLLSTEQKNRVIVIAGSSSYQGLGSEYLEALLEGEYAVVNLGTTRTTHGMIYLEAMKKYAHEGDLVIYAPENSSYMLGESELYWKTLRDLENMNNFYRYVDISNYTNVFGAFSDFNQNYRYKSVPRVYEDICTVTYINSYGDFQHANRKQYTSKYTDAYYITLNNRCKSKFEGNWSDVEAQEKNKDYKDPTNKTWCSFDAEEFVTLVNHAVSCAKTSGAKVYYAFAPVDADALVEGALNESWLNAYDELIKSIYTFDGILGSCSDYIYNHKYFYDCAFHLNDYGRTYRTYQLYLDICEAVDISIINSYDAYGKDFEGCIFETGSDGSPVEKVVIGKGN